VQSGAAHFVRLTADKRPNGSVASACLERHLPLALELAGPQVARGRCRWLHTPSAGPPIPLVYQLATAPPFPSQNASPPRSPGARFTDDDDPWLVSSETSSFAGGWTVGRSETIGSTGRQRCMRYSRSLTRLGATSPWFPCRACASGVERYRLLETFTTGTARWHERLASPLRRMRSRIAFSRITSHCQAAHPRGCRPTAEGDWLQPWMTTTHNLQGEAVRRSLWEAQRDTRAALRMAVDLKRYWWYRRP